MPTPSVTDILANNIQMTPITLTINGVDTPIAANWEYTDASIASAYASNMQAFVNIFNVTSTDPNRMDNLLGPAKAALQSLLDLARNPQPIPPGSNKYFGLTVLMARNLDQLLRSLRAVGWDGTSPQTLTTDILGKWKDTSLLSSTISDIISGAVAAIATNRSLQASVESVYIHEANDLISAQLSNMEQALQSSQTSLDTLSSLQNIKNQIVVSAKTSINFVYNVNAFNGDQGDFAKAYLQAASAHFGNPIIPHIPSSLVVYGSPPTTNPVLQNIIAQEATLQAQIQGVLDTMNQILNGNGVNTVGINSPTQTPEAQSAIAKYNSAVATYVSFIQNNPNATAAQIISAQKDYLTAANNFNQIFWNGRLFPPVFQDSNGNFINNPNNGDFSPGGSDPAARTGPQTSYFLTWKIITNPFSVPPQTQNVTPGDNVNDPHHYSKTYFNLADYAQAAIKAWNDEIRPNFQNAFNQLNAQINTLNTQINQYNQSNPNDLQVSTINQLPPLNSPVSWVAKNNVGTRIPVIDGGRWVHINGPFNTPPTNAPDKTWGDYEDGIFGTQEGSGAVFPNNPYANNPFSSVSPARLNSNGSTNSGDFGVAGFIFGAAMDGDINSAAMNNLNPIAITTSNNNTPIKNPIVNGGLVVDKEGRPVLTPTAFTAQGKAVFSQLLADRSALIGQITFLETITPKITTADGTTTTDPNSLLGKLRKILNDMNTTLTANGHPITQADSDQNKLAAFNRWILDNYDKAVSAQASQAGLLQQNITFGIVAAQSFNDSQKTNVQKFMFVFEEYYKSAAAILSKITEIIEKIAQGISR